MFRMDEQTRKLKAIFESMDSQVASTGSKRLGVTKENFEAEIAA